MHRSSWISAWRYWPLYALLALIGWAGGSSAAAPTVSTPAAQTRLDELRRVGVVRFTGPDYKPGLVRHMVMFRYKPGTSDAVRQQIRAQFLALQQTALCHGHPCILAIETGVQSSGEGADEGLQEAFLLTFRSEGDRNYFVGTPVVTQPAYYEPHHEMFKHFAFPHIAKAVVFDYTRAAYRPAGHGSGL
ncbi:Dabb family protein [Frateuria aurantia]